MKKILGLERPIGRAHYSSVVVFYLLFLMLIGEISLQTGNAVLFLFALISGLFYMFTLVIASGNRLEDAGISKLFRWIAITPLFFLLIIFLMLVPSMNKIESLE